MVEEPFDLASTHSIDGGYEQRFLLVRIQTSVHLQVINVIKKKLEKLLQDADYLVHTLARAAQRTEKEALIIATQKPGDAIIIPHMMTHTLLTIDLGHPAVLVGWECKTATDTILVHVSDELTYC